MQQVSQYDHVIPIFNQTTAQITQTISKENPNPEYNHDITVGQMGKTMHEAIQNQKEENFFIPKLICLLVFFL